MTMDRRQRIKVITDAYTCDWEGCNPDIYNSIRACMTAFEPTDSLHIEAVCSISKKVQSLFDLTFDSFAKDIGHWEFPGSFSVLISSAHIDADQVLTKWSKKLINGFLSKSETFTPHTLREIIETINSLRDFTKICQAYTVGAAPVMRILNSKNRIPELGSTRIRVKSKKQKQFTPIWMLDPFFCDLCFRPTETEDLKFMEFYIPKFLDGVATETLPLRSKGSSSKYCTFHNSTAGERYSKDLDRRPHFYAVMRMLVDVYNFPRREKRDLFEIRKIAHEITFHDGYRSKNLSKILYFYNHISNRISRLTAKEREELNKLAEKIISEALKRTTCPPHSVPS